MDPHAVKADPATTAMVAMALLRSGSTFTAGEYNNHLRRALQYLLNAVETSDDNSYTITNETGTQIQSKLGANIDVVLTSQFLTNTLDYLGFDEQLKARVRRALNVCIKKI